MPDKTSRKFQNDLKHRKEKAKGEKRGKTSKFRFNFHPKKRRFLQKNIPFSATDCWLIRGEGGLPPFPLTFWGGVPWCSLFKAIVNSKPHQDISSSLRRPPCPASTQPTKQNFVLMVKKREQKKAKQILCATLTMVEKSQTHFLGLLLTTEKASRFLSKR